MRILVLPRETSPTVAFVVRYGVGSVNEHVGNTGIAHVLEHLLFKGTETIGAGDVQAERELFREMDALQDSILSELARRPRPDSSRIGMLRDSIRALEDRAAAFAVSNELDRVYSENGARNLNATTEMEGTTYFVELPSNRAELWFSLEADRMANPVFREFYAERDVVAEERRSRLDDSPAGNLAAEHLATVFQAHPYGVPSIGYMSDIQTLTREDVREYYDTYYGARNAVVGIAGDVDSDQILEWAREYLGRVPEGREPPPVLTRESEQRGERRTEVAFDAEAQMWVGWPVVDAFHEDRPALDILSAVLTGGRTSRLQRRLVQEERIATFVSSSLGPGQLYPGHFGVQMVPRAPHTLEELEAALYDELDRLRESPPDSSELTRVRNQLEAGRIRRLASNMGLAFQLAVSESLYGDWRATFEYTTRLQDVTPEDVQRVVRTYFLPEKRTVSRLVPENSGSPGVDAELEDRGTSATGTQSRPGAEPLP
ncbi:MAG: pitrilysin family protein [Longimicrobiales bacterium]|nr:pitrilysin family protein [Longimicrobiales bacterium]